MENGSQAKHWKRSLCPSPTAPPTIQEKDFKAGEELTVFVIWVGEGQAERLQSRAVKGMTLTPGGWFRAGLCPGGLWGLRQVVRLSPTAVSKSVLWGQLQ